MLRYLRLLYTEYCNCTFVTEPGKPARREPSGNCPTHGSS